jgi:hypothetical protein
MKLTLTKDLTAPRAAAVVQVNEFAEQVRLRFVTPGAAMQQVYRQKVEEATGVAADIDAGRTPDPAAYPILSAEVGLTAPTLQQVSQIVLNLRDQWALVAARIEAARYEAQDAIAAATDPGIIATAVTAAKAQLDLLKPTGTPP